MAKHKKMLKKVQSAAAAALEAGPMKQRKLASKVFKKVHHKYADVTEQQVSELLQQLLQGDSVFQLQGSKVALNPAGAHQQQQQQPPAGAAAAADQQQHKKRKHQHEQQQQQQQQEVQDDRQHKKHKPKHVQQHQQEHSGPVSPAAALFGGLADQAEQQQTQQQTQQQSKHQKAQGKQQTHKQPQAAATAGGARVHVLAADAADAHDSSARAQAAAAAAAGGSNAAAKGVAAKFAQRLKAASNAAPAAAAAAASEDSADVEPAGRPKKPRAQKEAAAAAIAADAAAAADVDKAEQKAKRKTKKAAAAAGAGAAEAGGGNSLEDLMGEEADTWAEDYNRKNLKHGTFEPHEAEEVQEYVSAFARSRGLKEDQPGTCSWLLDLKGNGITKRMLTDAIYKPCLPHRARKSVWQYVHRIYPPYLWGPWTEAEDAQLRKLQAEKGNRWKEIGGVLGRHPEGVADRWNNLGKGVVRQMGRWTPDEEERLKSLIAKYKCHLELVSRPRTISETNVPAASEGARCRADLTRDDIDWNWVASQMGNRTAKQCNDKWFTSLAPSMLERGEWDITQDKQLVEALSSGLQEGLPEWEIDWEALVPGRSMEQCKRRWRVLLSFLPLEQRRTFTGAVAAAAERFKRSKGKSKGSKGRSAAAGGSSGDTAAAGGGGGKSPKQKQQQQQSVKEQEPEQPRLRQLQQPPWMQTAQPAQQQQQGRPSQQQQEQQKTFVRQKSNAATQQQEPAAAEQHHQQDEQPVSPSSPPQHQQHQQHKEKKKHTADRQHKEGKHKKREEQDHQQQDNGKRE